MQNFLFLSLVCCHLWNFHCAILVLHLNIANANLKYAIAYTKVVKIYFLSSSFFLSFLFFFPKEHWSRLYITLRRRREFSNETFFVFALSFHSSVSSRNKQRVVYFLARYVSVSIAVNRLNRESFTCFLICRASKFVYFRVSKCFRDLLLICFRWLEF